MVSAVSGGRRTGERSAGRAAGSGGDRENSLGRDASAGHVRQLMADKRITCRAYTRQEGEDAPEIRDWKWPY